MFEQFRLEKSSIDNRDLWRFSILQKQNASLYKAILFFSDDEFFDDSLKKEILNNIQTDFSQRGSALSQQDFEKILDGIMSEVPSSFAARYFYDNVSFRDNLRRFEIENNASIQETIFVEVII